MRRQMFEPGTPRQEYQSTAMAVLLSTNPHAAWPALFRAHRAAHPRAEVFLPSLFNVHDGGYVRAPRVSLTEACCEFRRPTPGARQQLSVGPASSSAACRRLGLFDEAMFVGFEDWELAVRALVRRAPVRVRPIDEIVLLHAHLPAAAAGDRAAARVRYDRRRLARSHRRLTTKHGITFPSDWPAWVTRQRAIMRSALKSVVVC